MNHESDPQLEQDLHRALRQLPDRPAPANLIARVQSAIAAQSALPWWQQSWFTWPRLAQFASALVAFALLAAFGFLPGFSAIELPAISLALAEWAAPLEAIAGVMNSLLGAAAGMVGLTLPVFLAVLAGGLGLIYLGCIALGTVFYRVAIQPR